jgi:hypothetical protein
LFSRVPSEFNPATVMIAELTRRMNAVPFAPFVIVTSSGKSYEVPTSDHLTITRLLREVFVEGDDYTIASVNPLHITALEPLSSADR